MDYLGPPDLRSHDFAAAKSFREAERERTGGPGGVAPPFRFGRAGSGGGSVAGAVGAKAIYSIKKEIELFIRGYIK